VLGDYIRDVFRQSRSQFLKQPYSPANFGIPPKAAITAGCSSRNIDPEVPINWGASPNPPGDNPCYVVK
jgi:hypothetical protein